MKMFKPATLSLEERRARWRVGGGIALSILVHASLFMLIHLATPQTQGTNEQTPQGPLEVSLVSPPRKPAKQPETPKPDPAPKPAPKKPTATKRPLLAEKKANSRFEMPGKAAVSAPTSRSDITPDMDMSTMVNASRERRQSAESSAAQENAAARAAEAGPSANEIASANINFQKRKANGGTNGIFQVTSKGPRLARYTFRGWTNDRNNSQVQSIEVDAGPDGNVELAIIRSMIVIIRKHYSGDFNWESQRLGKVVGLSARQQDTAGLEAFMMREFFGS
ncbi:hypothetical protein RGU70_08050 [Herbaspirillum sp. RTI4]|uniref:hypothetical protein n=1 Tax=Herbaspirillum sp. RTI4 TaxID=3048640 RepID=UPI002AB3F7C6|nr:hypothetical protein [Herbaspirillum sp. RTI4]MDY7578271.1 hypothetical protein [Herbaspirillum sp. RTI4]MEA9981236.1 hypothetical protein [Herbaspirillum sp. RTI4]